MKGNLVLMFFLSVININTDIFASSSVLEIDNSTNKIVNTQVICHSFDGGIKSIELKVMNILKNDVKEIFNELFKINLALEHHYYFLKKKCLMKEGETSNVWLYRHFDFFRCKRKFSSSH